MKSLQYLVFVSTLLLSSILLADNSFPDHTIDVKIEDGVYILGDDTFDAFVASHVLVLAEFYAPWCGHCKTLTPQYASAAHALADSHPDAKLAKIDATVNKELSADFDIDGFPTMKVFKNGHLVGDYHGRDKDEIVKYMMGKMGPSTVDVKDINEWNAFAEAHDVAVLGVFEDLSGESAQQFKTVADISDDASFALSSSIELLAELKIEYAGVILVKADGRSDYSGDLNAEDLKRFVTVESVPFVHELTLASSEKIFTMPIRKHMILYHKGSEGLADLKACFRDVSMAYAGEVLFVTADTQLEFTENSMPYFEVQKESQASLRAVDLEADKKYRTVGPTTCQAITDMIAGYLAGSLEHMEDAESDHGHHEGKDGIKEMPLPSDWDAKHLKVVVASNFEKVVHNPETAVFLKLYAEWCGHCQRLAPIWQDLADVFAANDGLVIAEVDADKNTVPVQLEGECIGGLWTPVLNYVCDDDFSV
ncbi:hypothetical protein SARC_08432 [Sphaeroforma arctica JP610]|uniref:protein disulfide-isomerase n=1 Tax=Sphaeroforma arctica JP610 TaxID=667725 RepID=A0A0L0FT82_9EUKA|nr:hypothetical protein SARC_08432 [Sphaeroforma arctica JP610]KNC79168.1 hypothetical protein SARC_08432 [Sphaeroforma arctica JP610]|eukprot:XP_014153070.1 hypothetical protein SARC_08432 [Sphaeroforma arctica JP610]